MINMKNKVILPSLVGIAAFTGIASGSALTSISASAATPPTPTITHMARNDKDDSSKGRHMGARGLNQVVVLNATAAKAKAAAEAAVAAGTVTSSTTEDKDAVYEAHVKKADGAVVSVEMDANFKAVSIETMPQTPVDGPKDLN